MHIGYKTADGYTRAWDSGDRTLTATTAAETFAKSEGRAIRSMKSGGAWDRVIFRLVGSRATVSYRTWYDQRDRLWVVERIGD